MDVIVDSVKEEELTVEDFPFICRICLLRGYLRPFEGGDYLLDLFMSITQIDVHSTIDFPRNICNSCVDKLKDISLSIDIWKNNRRSRKEREVIEDYELDMMSCIICSSSSNQMSFEANEKLSQLFRDITNIDVKDEMTSATGNGICSECIDKLEDISSFIRLSLCNDEKLENAVGRRIYVKCETYTNAIGIDSSTSNGLSSKDVAEDLEVLEEHLFEGPVYKIEETQENIESFSRETYQTELAICSQKFTHNLLPKLDPLYVAEEEFSHCDWTNKMLTNTKEKFKCDLCEKKFIRESAFQSHLLVCTGEKRFKCDFCEKSFIRKRDSRRHMQTHTGEKPFVCDCCGKSFTRKDELKSHLRNHFGEKPFKCDMCDKRFSQRCHLRDHMLTHTGERRIKCDYCEKSFYKNGGLKSHLRTHTGEKPFKCDMCDKSFSQRGHLGPHMLTHTGEKPFSCDICGKSFRQGCQLRTHILSHAVEDSFKCEFCEKSFNQKMCLKIHLRTHSGEKPFKCEVCDKSFSQGGNLRTHMRTHTGEKPFKCVVCDRSFSQAGNLQAHMLTHSG